MFSFSYNQTLRRDIGVTTLLLCLGWMAFPSTTVYASSSEGWGLWGTIGKIFNIALVVGILVYALRRPLIDYFESRRKAIAEEIAEAKRARDEAEYKLAEMEQRMAGLDLELKEIQAKASMEAEEERARILARSESEAAALIESAHKEAEALVRAGRMELREYAAQLAVDLAAERIHTSMDPSTQQRLVDNFAAQLNKLS